MKTKLHESHKGYYIEVIDPKYNCKYYVHKLYNNKMRVMSDYAYAKTWKDKRTVLKHCKDIESGIIIR